MSYQQMFQEKWIDLQVSASSREEVFQLVADRLSTLGVVNDGYLQGLLEREAQFPTGLITQYLNIALPHSEPEYVKAPFVYICRLKTEVMCRQMGDNQEMPVKDLFFLGITDGKNQVGLLQKLMTAFKCYEFTKQYEESTSVEQIATLFQDQMAK